MCFSSYYYVITLLLAHALYQITIAISTYYFPQQIQSQTNSFFGLFRGGLVNVSRCRVMILVQQLL